MNRRSALRIAGGGFIAAATASITGCSSDLPAQAIAAWKGPTGESELRHWILSHAILAPHSHNLQSWLVDLAEPDVITLRMDLKRLLPETDPFSRQMVMSQGTFLELLDQAARQRGHRTVIEPFPDGVFSPIAPDSRPTARIRLVPDPGVRPDPLFAQLFKRHTNRAAYDKRAPDELALDAIRRSIAGFETPGAVTSRSASSGASGITTGFTSPDRPQELDAHRRIAKEAWRIELVTPRTLMESLKVMRVGPTEIARHRDGITINDPMLRALAVVGLFDRSQPAAPDSSATTSQINAFDSTIDATPSFFWMVTNDNNRLTQLAAGRAYVRAQLAATAHGLSMQPLQQALQEYPEQAKPYQEIRRLLGATRAGQTVQMWARLGYGPAIGPSPRRGVDAHVIRT